MDIVPMSRKGYEKKKSELKHLEDVEMPAAAQRVANARAEGDLSENAEYHGARETQAFLQAKINHLKDELSRARIVDTSLLPKDEIVFGATVVVRDLDIDETETFTLVGAGDEDYDSGRILVTSPIGQGLIGQRMGATVSIKVPAGTIRFEILEIRFDDE